jgi:hypothetical protein
LPIASLGIIALGIRSSQFTGALNAQRIIRRLGEWNWLWFAPFIIAAGVISLGIFNSIAGIALFAVTGFAGSVTTPVIEQSILRQAPATVRATILSVDSLLFRVLSGLIGPAIGLVADGFNLPFAFMVVGFGFWVLILSVLWMWRRVNQPAVDRHST